MSANSYMTRFRDYLYRPVDIASLVFFRVAFGLTMLVEVWRYFDHNWIPRYYMRPDFHFKYYGFEWVQPWPGDGMYWHFVALGVLSVMITVGAFYRIASVLFLIGFSYVFLLDQARYLNHFYFVMLLSTLLCLAPAHKAFSFDAWRKPSMRSDTIPRWGLLMLVIQIEIVLLYAGFVKITPDWLALQPLTMWLAEDTALPIVGPFFAEKWALAIGAYGSILLHIIGAPLLFFRQTRPYVFVAYICFHLMNHTVFEIGIFPWLTMAGTTLFFDPSWPRRWLKAIARYTERWLEARRGLDPGAIAELAPTTNQLQTNFRVPPAAVQYTLIAVLGIWFAGQVFIPLRHYAYPGDVAWTEEGHRFSWRMKLRAKRGRVRFVVSDPASGDSWEVDQRAFLTPKQRRTMACRPDMLLQFAHYMRDYTQEKLEIPVAEVHVDAFCALNGRPYRRLIDPDANLAAIERDLGSADWILPLDEPLPPWPGPRRLARNP